jgi:hypothetical protein
MEEEDLAVINTTYNKYISEYEENNNSFQNIIPKVSDEELDVISVSEFNLHLIISLFKLIKTLKSFDEKDIHKYISFSRFIKGKDKTACDWCSIANGSLEIMHDSMLTACTTGDIAKLENISEKFEIWLQKWELFCLEHEHYLPLSSEDYIKLFKNKKLNNKIFSNIKLFLKLLDGARQIEQRWCPFKHGKELKFNRNYYIYDSHNLDEIELVKQKLRNEGKITGKEIIKQKDVHHKQKSIVFDEFLNHLKKIIT